MQVLVVYKNLSIYIYLLINVQLGKNEATVKYRRAMMVNLLTPVLTMRKEATTSLPRKRIEKS